MLGVMLPRARDAVDTEAEAVWDLEASLGVPVLGVIPAAAPSEATGRIVERRPGLAHDPEALESRALLGAHFDPTSAAAEAYRALRANVSRARRERAGTVLVMTTALPQEDATATAANLALALAQDNQRTLLVGADLRQPRIHRLFGIERGSGLADILVAKVPWHDCVRTVADIFMGRFDMEDVIASPGLDNLHIVEAGVPAVDPASLLAGPEMAEFLRAVRTHYDVVLIDVPAVDPLPDASIVAALADGVIVVHHRGSAGRRPLTRAKRRLEDTGANLWGIVLHATTPARTRRRRGLFALLGVLPIVAGLVAWQLDLLGDIRWPVRPSGRAAEPPPPPKAPPPSAPSWTATAPPITEEEMARTTTAAEEASTPPRAVAPSPPGPERPRPPAITRVVPERFALELGPFSTVVEAQQVERRLNQSGYRTVLLREETGGVFAVVIEGGGSARDPGALVTALREQGVGEFVPAEDELRGVRAAMLLPLRGAVELAERLRERGYQVRVRAQPGRAVSFVIRHGDFATRREAEARRRQLDVLGMSPSVVDARRE
jgi:capsular exopolysaccharide synthesis family protein